MKTILIFLLITLGLLSLIGIGLIFVSIFTIGAISSSVGAALSQKKNDEP